MAARQRKPSESFKAYRANLKAEEATTKARKQGSYVHVSKNVHDARGEGRTYRRA